MAKKRNWPPKGKSINYAFVASLRDTIQEQERTVRADMQDAENAYDGELKLGINLPSGVPIHKPSTAASKVDVAASHIITAYPRARIRPTGNPGKRNQARDERLTKAVHYALDRLNESATDDFIESVKHDVVRVGAGCVKIVFDEDEWPEPPDEDSREAREAWRRERKTAWPFRPKAIDPKTVYVSPDKWWPHQFVIEEQERFALDLWTRYPHWKSPKDDGDPARRVEWLEYWDADNYIAFADGKEVFRRPNIHPIAPYIFVEVQRRSRKGGQSLLSGAVISELQAEARVRTAMDALWQQVVFPRILVQKDEARQVRHAWNMGPAGVIPVNKVHGEERSVNWLEMPQLNSAMFNFLPLISESIRSATFDEALQGQRPTGVDFSAHQALLIGQARQSLRPFVNAMNKLATHMANMLLMYIDQTLADDIFIGDGDVGPSDIQGHYNAQVVYEPVSREDDDRRTSLGIQILSSKALPWQTVLTEYFKREDALEQMTKTWAEMVIFQLINSGMLAEFLLQSANIEEAEEGLRERVQGISKQITGVLPGFSRAGPEGQLSSRFEPGAQGGTLNTNRGDRQAQ